jgi:hypothetical protein
MENKKIIRHKVLGKVRRVVSTCNRKPQILFRYTSYFNCCFDFFQQNMGFYCNFDSCF